MNASKKRPLRHEEWLELMDGYIVLDIVPDSTVGAVYLIPDSTERV